MAAVIHTTLEIRGLIRLRFLILGVQMAVVMMIMVLCNLPCLGVVYGRLGVVAPVSMDVL